MEEFSFIVTFSLYPPQILKELVKLARFCEHVFLCEDAELWVRLTPFPFVIATWFPLSRKQSSLPPTVHDHTCEIEGLRWVCVISRSFCAVAVALCYEDMGLGERNINRKCRMPNLAVLSSPLSMTKTSPLKSSLVFWGVNIEVIKPHYHTSSSVPRFQYHTVFWTSVEWRADGLEMC